MALVIDVPLNTAIADLDEALRILLTRELARHGFEGVDIAFDAPSKEWSGKLTNPTIDLFLYDLREATDRAAMTPTEHRGNGQATVIPPPLKLELTYAVTGWTKAVEDEHRLLSQLLAILVSHRQLPPDVLDGRRDGARLGEVETSVGRPREEKADFWTSVGGEYKASIDLVAHLTIESGATFVRGPEVRTQTLRTGRHGGGGAGVMEELHRCGGTVSDADGAPLRDAWVALPDTGRWAVTDGEGRFRLGRVPTGEHRVVARTAAGDEAEVTVAVPGPSAELVVGARKRKPARGAN
jgi:hypothetical protein